MCQASRDMGERFTLYVFRHSYGLETAQGPCFRLLLLPDQYHWCNSKVQTHCSISWFTICDEASTSQCGATCAKASSTHDAEWQSSDEVVGQANKNMDCDSKFAGGRSSSEPHLLTQGNLNDIVRDLNLSKKEAGLLGSRLKSWNLLRQDTKVWVTQTSKRVYLWDSRSWNWCKTNSSMKTWKRLKEMHGCHLRGFARTS